MCHRDWDSLRHGTAYNPGMGSESRLAPMRLALYGVLSVVPPALLYLVLPSVSPPHRGMEAFFILVCIVCGSTALLFLGSAFGLFVARFFNRGMLPRSNDQPAGRAGDRR